jgi:hypothetical protein
MVPINENLNKTFYISSMGSVKVFLKTASPITNDTLYLCYPILNQRGEVVRVQIDTILTTLNGYFTTVRVVPPSENFFWGRGHNNFIYNPSLNGISKYSGTQSVSISGDPVVDS